MVFLNAAAIISLREYLDSRKDNTEALFVSERAPHQRIKKNAIENVIKCLGERAGLNRRCFPHLLRHTCACTLLKGMKLDEVQVYLGHERIDTTRIYAKTDMEQLRVSFTRVMAA